MLSVNLENVIRRSIKVAYNKSHEYTTIEHLSIAALSSEDVLCFLYAMNINVEALYKVFDTFINGSLDVIRNDSITKSEPTIGFRKVIQNAILFASSINKRSEVTTLDLLHEIVSESGSHSSFFFMSVGVYPSVIKNYIDESSCADSDNFFESTAFHGMFSVNKEFDNNTNLSNIFFLNKGHEIRLPNNANDKKNTCNPMSKEEIFLSEYAVNINKEVINSTKQHLVGREDELDLLINILCKKDKRNPLLIGDPGVGKTELVYTLARLIVNDTVPDILKGCTILMLDIGSMVAGTRYRGDFEDRLKKFIGIIEKSNKYIIFIDEVHLIVGAGSTNGNALDASNLLKPHLSRGKIVCIGATTKREYHLYLSKDKALSRRFYNINIEEPSVTDSVKMITNIIHTYEEYHNVTYDNSAIQNAVELSTKYIGDYYLPDKAIDILDESGSRVCISKNNVVNSDDIIKTISRISKVPLDIIGVNKLSVASNLEGTLSENIFGQEEAIKLIIKNIVLFSSGIFDETRPIGCFLFVGPTGVGKTELVNAIAKAISINLIRIDMSEYSEGHAVSKMLGSTPGYVGYEEYYLSPLEKLRQKPYSILLLDEIEKAHPNVKNLMLQAMDYGFISDSMGRKISTRNAIIIMTSNAGSASSMRGALGFDSDAEKNRSASIHKSLESNFSREFLNRINDVIIFRPLNKKSIFKIIKKYLDNLALSLHKHKNISMVYSNKVVSMIYDKAEVVGHGARKVHFTIERLVKRRIAEDICLGLLGNNFTVSIATKGTNIVFSAGVKSKKNNQNYILSTVNK